MSTFLQSYHAQSIVPCKNCAAIPGLARQLTFHKLLPFVGRDSRGILLLGHSPKVRTSSKIDTTLDLNHSRRLRQYVVREILEPLGLDLEWCVATNIVRCLTHSMPEDTKVNGVPLMDAAFGHCQAHLLREITEIKPRLVVSLSETVSDALQDVFEPQAARLPMKEIFGTVRSLNIGGAAIPWIPVVHIPKPNSIVKAYYFPLQTQRLAALRDTVQKVISTSAF